MAYTTINKPADYFNTKLYTGNGSARTITGVGFQPDWVWVKSRSATSSHYFYDVVRGDNLTLQSNSNAAEANVTTDFTGGGVGSQASDGFTIVAGTSNTDNVNTNNATYASWNWLAGGSASSNTDGSITSSVSANTTSGFSIVSFTGTGANATVGHGLGKEVDFIIIKNRNDSAIWSGYHRSLGGTKYISINSSAAAGTASTQWNDTDPTSSVFSVGTSNNTNDSGDGIIAYCFASIKGFSNFGSYTGNGSADGTFVYTGFKPKLVIIKRSDGGSGYSWHMQNSEDDGANPTNYVNADTTSAENSSYPVDFLSNGFKPRTTLGGLNASGGNFIYMAFAENPLTTSGGTPATAR